MDISIVIPCYNTRNSIPELHKRLVNTLVAITGHFEIIYVDDCSPQHDYEVIRDIARSDHRVRLVVLSRNFGQQAAISAGLNYAKGKWIILMDADLQDRPEEAVKLYAKAQEGYDIVYATTAERRDSWVKIASSYIFHLLFAYLTDSKNTFGMRNYGIYNKKVIEAFLMLKEQYRGFALLIRWLGFNTTAVDVIHDRRVIGKTSYSFLKSINLALDSFIAFSDRPLKSTMVFGLFISTSALIAGLVFFIRAILGYSVLVGWTSLILSIWFMGGFTVFFIGLIGLYVGKVFNEAKGRPHYIIDKTINIDE